MSACAKTAPHLILPLLQETRFSSSLCLRQLRDECARLRRPATHIQSQHARSQTLASPLFGPPGQDHAAPRGKPSLCNVVSTASCDSPDNGKPSTTTSKRRVSVELNTGRSSHGPSRLWSPVPLPPPRSSGSNMRMVGRTPWCRSILWQKTVAAKNGLSAETLVRVALLRPTPTPTANSHNS